MKKHWKLISIILSLLVLFWVLKKSVFMRWFGYADYPTPVADEFTYVWQAKSLKENGLPMAWTLNSGVYKDTKYSPVIGSVNSFGIETNGEVKTLEKFKKDPRPLSAVKEIDYVKGKEQMLFVAPFFDHPPLGGMIYSLGVNKNVKEVEEVKSVEFRKPTLFLAIITAVLLFVFLSLISSNVWVGLLGAIVYSIAPTYLLATRTAFLENVVPVFVIPHLIFLFWYVKKHSSKFSLIILFISGILGGLSVLAKEPAAGFLVGSTILLWRNKIKIKNVLIFFLSCSIPILVYVGWGWFLHKDLFMAILLTNSSRVYFGAIKIVTMLETLKFKNFPTDGWWIWGLLSFVLISLKKENKNILFLTVPLFTHLLMVLLLGSGNYSWYWISAIPFLAGCSGLMIWKIISNPTIVEAMLFFLIPFSSSYYWGREALGLLPDIGHYRKAILIFALMLFLRKKFEKNKIIKYLWVIFMIWLIYKMVIFGEVFIPYLISHWGNLSITSLPNY